MTQNEEDYEAVSRLLEACNESLSKAEYDFLENCRDRLEEGRALTEPMRKWLNDIWAAKGG